jgi:antiphage defense system Thoeris ThsB-like protein
MYRQKRADTLVKSIEQRYGISLNARADARLGNLLDERGFSSLSELVKAHRGRLGYHASPRRVFLSFHRDDLLQVTGLRLMMRNARLALEISDDPNREPVGSVRASYIKRVLRDRIRGVEVVMCMIGNGTAWREWVDWELKTAIEERRGICGVRLKGSRGRVPDLLRGIGAPVAPWDVASIIAAIECAAARRS